MKGIIIKIKPIIKNERLKVIAKIKTEENSSIKAFLPNREVSAILPRNILIGNKKKVPGTLLKTISPIIKRISCGRPVRLWKYKEIYYFSFLSWRNIILTSKIPRSSTAEMNTIPT